MKRILAGLATLVFVLGMDGMANATFVEYDGNATTSSFDAATSGYSKTMLDFEALERGTVLDDEFSAYGVTFEGAPGDPLIVDDIYSSNVIGTRGVRVPWTSSTQSVLNVSFTDAVGVIGGYFIDNGSVLNVELFGVNNFHTTISVTAESGDSAEWWGVVFENDVITRAVITTTNTGDGFGFDNFTYGTAPVPEPATLILLGLGLAGFAGTRRRKLKK